MKVVPLTPDGKVVVLSHFEVWMSLKKHRTPMSKSCLKYLTGCQLCPTSEKMAGLMNYLATKNLSDKEILQVVNICPRTVVELYLIIDDCDERYGSESAATMLAEMQQFYQ